MANPVIISYNSASRKEQAFATKLVNYLAQNNIETVPGDPNRSEPTMKQWLLNAQWLVLILTPEAIKSPWVQSLVNTAFDRVRQGHMQGVLALVFSSNPVEPEDMPNSLWSTIRTYYAGESDEDQQRTFEKVVRTLGYTRASTPATSSSTSNWASAPGYQVSASFRPLPEHSQPAHSGKVRLIISLIAALILIILSATLLRGFLITNYQATLSADVAASVTANTKANASASARIKATAIAHVHATASARTKGTATAQANANATAQSQQAMEIYTRDTNGTPAFSMSLDANKQWSGGINCSLTNDGIQVTNANAGQYTPCIAKGTSFKNFAYQVQMMISGDAGGLIFRSDGAKKFYRFSLDLNGHYELFQCNACPGTSISDDNSALIHGNIADRQIPVAQSYTLTVIAMDKIIYLYVNGIFINQVNNASILIPGEIGVYAASVNQSTEVTFSNVQVWNIQ